MRNHDEFARRLAENLYEKFRRYEKDEASRREKFITEATNFIAASLCLRCLACHEPHEACPPLTKDVSCQP